MTPILQRVLVENTSGGRRGDCLRAAIASLLDLPLTDVPHFVQVDADGGMDWWTHLTSWLHAKGLALDNDIAPEPDEFYLAIGPSPRSYLYDTIHATTIHATVYRDGTLAHDPYPSGGGLCEVWERWVLRPLL